MVTSEASAGIGRAPLRRSEALLLACILLTGAGLRLAWNDVVAYSRADEAFYLHYARQIVTGGWASYPELVAGFLQTPSSWVFPPPLRWAAIALDWGYCEVVEACEMRDLATVSTLAGVAALLFTFLLGRDLLGVRPALVATALTVTSPLQLAVGRRALVDETFCALVVAFLWLYLRTLRSEERAWLPGLAAIAVATLALGVKELFVFLYPVFVLLLLVVRWHRLRSLDLAVLIAPPLLHVAIFSLLARSAGDFWRLTRTVAEAAGAPYAVQYQSGPAHRPLLDLLVLAPVVMLVAVGAAARLADRWRESSRGERWLALALFVTLLTCGLLPSKNVRYAIAADPLARLLAAAFLAGGTPTGRRWVWPLGALVVVFNAAVELALFHRIFIVHGVYDPVTQNLLQALGMLPR